MTTDEDRKIMYQRAVTGELQRAIESIVPSPAGDGLAYAEYTNSAEGIRQALFDMYQNGNGQEFALYVGSGGSLSLPANLTSKTIPATVDNTNMTFYRKKIDSQTSDEAKKRSVLPQKCSYNGCTC